MIVSGKLFYNKVQELRPDISTSIKPEILNKICEDSTVQPFLRWFCENVTHVNVLSNEEVKIMNRLEKAGEWLQGAELDDALKEVTQDYPELLKFVTSDDPEVDDLFGELETMKEIHKEDNNFVDTLKKTLINLQELESKLEEDIEEETTLLGKEKIELCRAYNDCNISLTEFDRSNRQFLQDIECLLNVYAVAGENRGTPILWTQMPIELFIKQMDRYNDYLDVYIRRKIEISNKDDEDIDSNYVSLVNDSREKQVDETVRELTMCKKNLIDSKINEIGAKVQRESYVAMVNHIQDIYNNGILKIPQQRQLKEEILELSRKRNLLEEDIMLLQEKQVYEIVQKFVELEIAKIVKNDAYARIERRKIRLEKLKGIHLLAKQHGHVHADLLCMLMEKQFQCLKEVAEFVADARHYLATEYSLSAARCESMHQQQDEYAGILTSSKSYNQFDQLFMAIVSDDETSHEPLNNALKKYNDLIAENQGIKMEAYLDEKMSKLETLEDEVITKYMNETHKGPTVTFEPIPHEVKSSHDEMMIKVHQVQEEVTRIRNKLKEQMRSNTELEREKDVLWQYFLIDPDILKKRYNEIKQTANLSHFKDGFET